MKAITGLILVAIFFLASCSDTNKKNVKYLATGSISAYNLYYLNENNELTKVEVVPQSTQDQWSYSLIADEGDIVYISGNYKDINSSLKIMILVDGKIYKQSTSKSDTLSNITVSGTIPYQ